MDETRPQPFTSPTTADSTPSPFRVLRHRSGLSASAFASALGVQVSTLYEVERGTARPGRAYRQALSDIGVNVEQLLDQQRQWREEQSTILRRKHSARIKNAAEAHAPNAEGGHRS